MATSGNGGKGPSAKTCFVISPLGPDGSETRVHADKVLRHLIEKAVPSEYQISRADKISDPGIITNQIVSAVESADLVIADLTGQNPNVFYELALRHAVRKPIVHIIKVGGEIPFDINGVRTVFYDIYDPDNLVLAQNRLAEFISAIGSENFRVESPFTIALPRSERDSSEGGLEGERVLSELQKIAVRIQNIESKVNYNELAQSGNLRQIVMKNALSSGSTPSESHNELLASALRVVGKLPGS